MGSEGGGREEGDGGIWGREWEEEKEEREGRAHSQGPEGTQSSGYRIHSPLPMGSTAGGSSLRGRSGWSGGLPMVERVAMRVGIVRLRLAREELVDRER